MVHGNLEGRLSAQVVLLGGWLENLTVDMCIDCYEL